VNIPGNSVIVLRVWSCDTAAICTHAAGCCCPNGWPGGTSHSLPSSATSANRHGPTNSKAPHDPTTGSLPQPFNLCTTPSRHRNRFVTGSMAYHHKVSRACSGVYRQGFPA
jgi:hypothetical protein